MGKTNAGKRLTRSRALDEVKPQIQLFVSPSRSFTFLIGTQQRQSQSLCPSSPQDTEFRSTIPPSVPSSRLLLPRRYSPLQICHFKPDSVNLQLSRDSKSVFLDKSFHFSFYRRRPYIPALSIPPTWTIHLSCGSMLLCYFCFIIFRFDFTDPTSVSVI